MNALVTGGGGFLGRYLVEQLLARGDRVRVFARGDYPEIGDLGAELVRGDIQDATAVSAAVQGCDTVFHTAAIPGIWGPWELYYGINTVGTQHVIQACQGHGVSRLIYTSSPSVIYDGQPHENIDETIPYPEEYLCHYPHSKMLAERAVLAAADGKTLATCALRPHLIWGPRDNHLIPRLIRRAQTGKLRRVGDGSNRVSVAYVENVAAAHLQACDKLKPGSAVDGQAFFINEPEPVNLWQWIDELLALADLPPVKKTISAKAAYRAGAMLEFVWRTLRKKEEPPMTRFLAQQLASSHYYSIEKARRCFDYQSVVSFARGMEKLTPELKRLATPPMAPADAPPAT